MTDPSTHDPSPHPPAGQDRPDRGDVSAAVTGSTEDARAARSRARRNQVLAAATTLFRERGFHGTSMAELAKAAGMSVGHVYHYFPSKEAIIEAIGRHDLEDFMRLLDAIATGDPVEGLIAGIDQGIDKATDQARAALHIEVLAESVRNAAVSDATSRTDDLVRERLRAVLASARPTGEAPDDDYLDTRIDLIQALFEGVMCRSLRHRSNDRAALRALMQAAMRAVLQHPLSPRTMPA